MIIKNEDVQVLRQYIPNIEIIIQEDDVQKLLDMIDDCIIDNMLKYEDNEPDQEGVTLQQIYDRIFYLDEDESEANE